MNDQKTRLNNLAVVLMHPKLSENIGTAARAAGNMGLGRLIVVDPYRFEAETISAAATRAGAALVEGITVCPHLEEALAEFQYVVGTTARLGSHRGPFFTPRDLAPRVVDILAENKVALLFGPERTGLTTAQLRLCQAVVRIPTIDDEVSSLNVAQAVLILGYEVLLAAQGPSSPRTLSLAPFQETRDMYDHLSQTMVQVGFLPDKNTDHWLMSFKRIFNRSGLTHGECNLLRGMCRQVQWALAQAEKKGGQVQSHPGTNGDSVGQSKPDFFPEPEGD